ncbi:uncharacterized protein LOC119084001 [Bradysia coprophila]|uniref:uncharacterized protein LOC119084001 n=1 Tax=Bradysia coprophila TaxID=38358 RepID=UPI00187D8E26|nr:uncharacterized protein LOC119084001 [Bradysia coprophila]
MLLNQCTILLSVVFVVSCRDEFTKKYQADDNRIIKRLHASPHAKLFLNGCGADYTELNETARNESDFFKLSKSKDYLFAIFTLDQVSLIISNTNPNMKAEKDKWGESDDDDEDVPDLLFNITLGINKNTMAQLEVFENETKIGNATQHSIPILPTIPYYVNISITGGNISVYEARTGASYPFMSFSFSSSSNWNLSNYEYFVKFRHSSPIYAHYECCEACTPWIYTRISGCSKYSARTASKETAHLINYDSSTNRTDDFVFNQIILVHHDGNPTFRAKIIFSQSDVSKKNRYEIGLSESPTILHYSNKQAQFLKTLPAGATLKREYTSPFIVNITITRDGIVSLRQPYEQYPFLEYINQRDQPTLEAVNVKYMIMVKAYEDFVRYDFYHDCTDLLFFARKQELTIPNMYNVPETSKDDNGTDKYPMIWSYVSKRFNTTKHDVLHVFQDSFLIYDKWSDVQIEDNSDYKEKKSSENSTKRSSDKAGTNSSSKGDGSNFSDMIKKAAAGVGSCLFIGILKVVFQMDCVKNLMKDVDVDDDRAKELRKNVSNVVHKNLVNTLGIEDDD